MTTPSRKPGHDDTFVVAALHRHLKEQLASTTRMSEYSRGVREGLLDALGFLDGVSDGRYPTSFEGGVQ